MKKIKKVLSSFGLMVILWTDKMYVNAIELQQAMYASKNYKKDPLEIEKEKQRLLLINKRIDIVKFLIVPIILILVGVGVIINKKMSKKSKLIVLIIFVLIGLFCIFFINKYIDNEMIIKLFNLN